jgi:uncharacterized protein (TIGR02001 family)
MIVVGSIQQRHLFQEYSMIKSRLFAASALLAVAGAAHADFTVTPAVTNDYDFRGVTQTLKDPAFQLGGNYSHESGFYAGVWGSNVDFGPGDPSVEIDLFAGFAGGDAAETFGYDVGAIFYDYPGDSDLNTLELYAGISKHWFAAKLWYSPNVGSSSESGWYAEGNVTVPLPHDFSIQGHVGRTFGDASWSGPVKATDYSIGVGAAVGNFNISVKYVDGSKNAFDNRVIGLISTTLPWKSE